jgi:hypothetical protein
VLNIGVRGRNAGVVARRGSFRTSSKRADAVAREQPIWTAIGEGSLLLGVTGGLAMSTPIADVRFLRGVFAALLFATATCGAGVVFALLAVPSPPGG